MCSKGLTTIAAAFIAAGVLSGNSAAEEITPGTLLNAASIDDLKDKTLDGHRVGDLLTEVQELMIREHGFRMILENAKPIPYDKSLEELTSKYSDSVKLESDGTISGFVAGVPFPNISQDDPDAGTKLIYNFLRSPWLGQTLNLDPMYFIVIDGEKGIERQQGWQFKRYLMEAQREPPHKEDDEIIRYQSLINLFPQDTRGLGVLTVNYADGRLPDVYAYIKSIRRVRRLSSGAWADPVAGSDLMTDELFGGDFQPQWFKSWKIIGKRHILSSLHGTSKGINLNESDPAKRYPLMDFDNAPYWNHNEPYEPHEVWVLESIPPDTHLMSKRVYYISTHPYAFMAPVIETYDRQGDFWRMIHIGYQPLTWDDGTLAPAPGIVAVYDVKALHGTVLYNAPLDQYHINPPGYKASDFTPQSLSRQLR